MGIKYQWVVSAVDICFPTGLQPYLSGLWSHQPSEVSRVQLLDGCKHVDDDANGGWVLVQQGCGLAVHRYLPHLKAEGKTGRSSASQWSSSWNARLAGKNQWVAMFYLWISKQLLSSDCSWKLWYVLMFLWGGWTAERCQCFFLASKLHKHANKFWSVLFPGRSRRHSRFQKGFNEKESRGVFLQG